MKVSRNFVLSLGALLFGFLLIPRAALAGTADCPVEPKQNEPIASGDSFAGANCVLNTPGDVDSFVFNGASGDTWQLVLGYQGGASNMCLTLYDPNSVIIFPTTSNPNNCTDNGVVEAVVDEQTLTTTGKYTMVITEPDPGVSAYALSLERINPFPPDAQPITLSKVIDGAITPTSQNAFTFAGVTTGTYELSLTYAGGSTNVCIYLYYPGTTQSQAAPDQGCTDNGVSDTYQFNFTPPKNATYMVLINGVGNDGTASYNFEVTCVIGICPTTFPPCTLKDTVSYSSGTLTMDFTVGNSVVTTWNALLVSQSTTTPLSGFPITQPKTVPPVPITKTTSLSPAGTVGILSTLTTPTSGIACSSWELVNTGKP
jgi:hypothetical protein